MLSSPCKTSLPKFKPELTREGIVGWKCPLFLCMLSCAVSHSARKSRVDRMDSLPKAQLYPDSGCSWQGTWTWRPPLHTFLSSLERNLLEVHVPKCFAVQKPPVAQWSHRRPATMLHHSTVSSAYFPKKMSFSYCATCVSLSLLLTTSQIQAHIRNIKDMVFLSVSWIQLTAKRTKSP